MKFELFARTKNSEKISEFSLHHTFFSSLFYQNFQNTCAF